jgi:magnesium-transporting ATPase (P-type)
MTITTPAQASELRPWHALDVTELQERLETGAAGLSRQEAQMRLVQHGANQLEEAPPPSNLALLLHQFRSPLIYILLVAAVITVLLHEYVDAAVIAAVLLLNAVIGFTQERRAEQSVRALMRLMAPHARVIRNGREWDVESRELVPGDLVLLESGTRVPADSRLVSSTALRVDESLLTGESLPASKHAAPVPENTPPTDRDNMAYAGTIVASGRGRGYVVATGAGTQIGAIATQVRGEERAETPLQHRMAQFARIVGVVVAVSSLLAFGIGVAIGNAPAEMFMVAVAMAVAAVPEGLPVALTITLAVGVRRMARRNAIIRRLPAVETLGSTTTIGSDKTGTLTENRMTVRQVWAGGQVFHLQGEGDAGVVLIDGEHVTQLAEHQPLYLTLLTGVLTNEATLYRTDQGIETQGDPTEAALLVAAVNLGIEPEIVRAEYAIHEELPFEPERQYSASIRTQNGERLVFVKGAPERVLAMCANALVDTGPVALDQEYAQAAAAQMAGAGLRVLAMAYRRFPLEGLSRDPIAVLEQELGGLTLLGLQGMMDPPRASVREAIDGCREAGIRVLMITGDHAATAQAIGRLVGIGDDETPVLTGTQLAAMDDRELGQLVDQVPIYARVAPDQKLRVVRALQERGEVVAVTGDGVNDAPALKAADIGVAMGKSGTDVAREASDMVLADDNFVSIYAAVEEGRVTFDNVRKVTFFLISTGAAAIIAILSTLILGWPLPFLPAQLLWLNLVTNGLQDVALAFEPGERGVLRRPPRRKQEGIISRLLWERTILSGLVMAAGTLFLFSWELDQSGSLARAQTVALTTMVLFQVFQAGNSRSERTSIFRLNPLSNPFLFFATAAALTVHIGALHLGFTQFVLRVEPLDLQTWGRMLLVASTVLIAVEAHKWQVAKWRETGSR